MAEWMIAAGAGINVASSIFGADAAADAMEQQAELAIWQGRIAREQAEFAAKMQLQAGRERSEAVRRGSRRAVGQAVAEVGASGVELSGSPLVVIGEKIRRDEINAARVITNAHMRALSEEASGRAAETGAVARADALDTQADYTRAMGFLQALSSGLNAAGSWYATTSAPGPNYGTSPGGYTAGGYGAGF